MKYDASLANGKDLHLSARSRNHPDGTTPPSGPDNNARKPLNEQLHHAVYTLDLRSIRWVLAQGADPNYLDVERVLSVAASQRRPAILEALLNAGADPQLCDRGRAKPLHHAARICDPHALETLLAHGANPNAGNACGETALHILGEGGTGRFALVCVQILIRHGAELEPRCRQGRTPLLTACLNNNFGLAKVLLTLGADINARDRTGNTCLHLLARSYHDYYSEDAKISLLGTLLDKGAKPNAVSPAVPSPLNFAVGRGSLRVVKKLLAAGANPALKKFAWYSPLERAIESRESFDSAVTLALLRKGKFPRSLMARLLSTTVQYGSTQASSVQLIKTLFKRGVGSEAITEADFRLMLRHVAKKNRGSSSTGIPSNTRLVVNQLSDFGCEIPPFVIVALL